VAENALLIEKEQVAKLDGQVRDEALTELLIDHN
jgi:hypothetical protein